jgi:hypothetical protein
MNFLALCRWRVFGHEAVLRIETLSMSKRLIYQSEHHHGKSKLTFGFKTNFHKSIKKTLKAQFSENYARQLSTDIE